MEEIFDKFAKQLQKNAPTLLPEKVYSTSIPNKIEINTKLRTIWNKKLIDQLKEYKSIESEQELFNLYDSEVCLEAYRLSCRELKIQETELDIDGLIKFVSENKVTLTCSPELASYIQNKPEYKPGDFSKASYMCNGVEEIGVVNESRIIIDPYLPLYVCIVLPENFFNVTGTLGEEYDSSLRSGTGFEIEGNYINAKINYNPDGKQITIKDDKLRSFNPYPY